MTEPIKSITPVQSRIITPINEGNVYQAKSYIQFKINASELPMWLVNDSYLRFDIEYDRSAYSTTIGATGNTNLNINKSYIRNAANIFNMINVKYGGEDIYSQTLNIEQNTIKMLTYGESYLNANYATFTTNKMIQENKAYLIFDNGTATKNDATETIPAVSKKILNVMIPVNQLLPMFQDVNSTGFPVGYLKKQIEINLYIAEPHQYLVDYDDVMNDFSEYFRRCQSSTGDRQPVMNVDLTQRYPSNSVKITNVRMYCSCYVPTNDEAAVIQNKINSDGMKYKYNLWHIGIREVKDISTTNNLPFSVTTNNTSSFILYCHNNNNNTSPSLMHRPLVNSLYLRFGEMQLPFQPIPGDSFSNPFEYKFTSDDVLNNIDTYFSETNNDYNNSYQYMSINSSTDTTNNQLKKEYLENNKVPASSFVLMGANFTNSNDKLGSASSRWNSQYQASFNSNYIQNQPLRFLLGVKTEYGLIVKDGMLAKINL